MLSSESSRRDFLKLGAAAAIPFILPSRILSAETSPNSKLGVGIIGFGTQGHILLNVFIQMDIKILAVCDVAQASRDDAKAHVDEKYGNKDCATYKDFRELLSRKDIDAVIIATPDHWHAIITLAALKAGKDVYCEKPLTHNIHEAIEVMEAVRKHKRVLQTGSMQRSMSTFRIGCELVLNGVIGKLTHIDCGFGIAPRPCDLPEEQPEPGLDWDMWLGPAPVRPYSSVLRPRGAHFGYPNWRLYQEYGGGGNCDFGAHHLDIAHWGMGMDESGPVEIRPPERQGDDYGSLLTYANGVTVRTVKRLEGDRGGLMFTGTEGQVWADRDYFKFVRGSETIMSQNVAAQRYLRDAKIKLIRTRSHVDDFLERVKDRGRPVSCEIEGAHTAIACHLINQACIHNATIKWDPKKMRFVGGTGDKKWLTRDYRKPWKV